MAGVGGEVRFGFPASELKASESEGLGKNVGLRSSISDVESFRRAPGAKLLN